MIATSEMPVTDIVCDASVVLQWFVDQEADVEASRGILQRHRDGTVTAYVLDLTTYEIANALLRGRRAGANAVAAVLDALAGVCPVLGLDSGAVADATSLAERHDLTFYDAACAAVARRRNALLVTGDRELLRAGLGRTPSDALATVDARSVDRGP